MRKKVVRIDARDPTVWLRDMFPAREPVAALRTEAWYSLWRARENQFVLPQINDHYVEFVQKIHTQHAVDALSQAFGNPVRVHGEDSMIPPKYSTLPPTKLS